MTMKTVIFMHLHRSGGTTFLKLLDNIYDASETYTIDGKRFRESAVEFSHLSENEREKYRLVKGHLFWGFHGLCPNETTYITILRHPFDRSISQYRWHLRPDCFYPIPPDWTLEAFLESGRFISTDNGMTRFISGKDREDVEYGKCSPEMLGLAKTNLERYFIAFGLTEYYDETLILFKKILEWQKFPFYQRKNVNHQKPANPGISSREHEVLLKYNRYDIELYEYARQLFEERIEKEDQSFRDEVALFKQLNSGV
jgi:hypothetical protein